MVDTLADIEINKIKSLTSTFFVLFCFEDFFPPSHCANVTAKILLVPQSGTCNKEINVLTQGIDIFNIKQKIG